MGTSAGAAARDRERLAADRAWVRWGMAAAVTGKSAWLAGFALIPLDAKLDKGDQHLVQVTPSRPGLCRHPGCRCRRPMTTWSTTAPPASSSSASGISTPGRTGKLTSTARPKPA